MIKICRSICKIYNKDKSIDYTLQYTDRSILRVNGRELKEMIRNNEVCVTNLSLSCNNRLISIKDKPLNNILGYIKYYNKVQVLGNGISYVECEIQAEHNEVHLTALHINTNVVIIPDFITDIDYNYQIYNHNNIKNLKVIHRKNKMKSLKKLFHELSIEELDLSEFDTTGVVDLGYMIENNFYLKRITFGEKFTTSSVKYMIGMFKGCESIEEIDISKWDTTKVIDTSEMFRGCTNLREIKGTENLRTPKLIDCSYMFQGCEKIKYLDLHKMTADRLENMKYMFYNTPSLQYVNLKNFRLGEGVNKQAFAINSKCREYLHKLLGV